MSGKDTPQPPNRIIALTPRSIRAERRAKIQLDITPRPRELTVQLEEQLLSPIQELVECLIERSPYLSVEQATCINNWDTTGVVLNLEDNFQSVRTTSLVGWAEFIGDQGEASSPIYNQPTFQPLPENVHWPDEDSYRPERIPELNFYRENPLVPFNTSSYQLNEKNEIVNTREDGEEAIDRAEDIVLSIILDCLETIVKEPPLSWHSCEDRSLASSSHYQSVINPSELRLALNYTISHPKSSNSSSSTTQSLYSDPSQDTREDLEEPKENSNSANNFAFQSNNLPLQTRTFESPEQPIEEERREAPPMAENVLPVVMMPGQPTDRPYSTIPFPIFYGQPGADPDRHIKEFLTSCNSNNARHETHWLAIFPGTLQGSARDWFNRQSNGTFANWDDLRTTFLNTFRPIAFNDRLMDQLHDLLMRHGESIDSYYGRFSDIIMRIPQTQIVSDGEKLRIFLKGLSPSRLRTSVKEGQPENLTAAYARAKFMEETIYEDLLGEAVQSNTQYIFPPGGRDTNGIINSYNNQYAYMPPVNYFPPQKTLPQMPFYVSNTMPTTAQNGQLTIAAPVRTNATVGNQIPQLTYPTPANPMESSILSLTNKLDELTVAMAGNKVKRDQPIDDRANVWCTNCKGQGHMLPDCPSPMNQPPQCRFCGGNHDISNCNKLMNAGRNDYKGRNRNGQAVYQVDDNNNQDNYSNNSNNWNDNRNNSNNRNQNYNNRRNGRNQNNNQNYNQNNNNNNPNFNNNNPNNFNNGGFNNNPNKYIPNQNQGWNAIPYGTPNQSGPTYGGREPSWETSPNVQCYNCKQWGHVSRNCPNARANVPYIPQCGNCKQSGHTSAECNAPRRLGPRDIDGIVQNKDKSPKLVLLEEMPETSNNRNNTNNNCQVNYVATCASEDSDESNQQWIIDGNNYYKVNNVERVITRARANKEKPDGKQPLKMADVISPLNAEPIKANRPIKLPEAVPQGGQLSNLSEVGKVPTKDSLELMANHEVGMPKDATVPRGAKVLNPISNHDFQEFNPAPTVFDYPLVKRTPPIAGEKQNESSPIIIQSDHPNWTKKDMPTPRYTLVEEPSKNNRLHRNRRPRPIGIMKDGPHYDLLKDLGKIKADISIRQLLGIAPTCKLLFHFTMVRKRNRSVNEVGIGSDPGAPTLDVNIDGILVIGVQLDGGSSVNLMNAETMWALHLNGLKRLT